jgi:capsular polysaccharide biosynthesis protein
MSDNQQRLLGVGRGDMNVLIIVRLLLSRLHWILLSGILIAAIVFGAVKLFVTPTYESRVSFYVYNSSDTASRTGTVNNNDLQAAESLATTYSKILGSNSVLDAVLEDLGENSNITRKELSNMTHASVITDTQLLEVVVTSADAEFSCDVASSFAAVAPTEIVRITKAGGVEVVDRPEISTERPRPE